MKLDWKVHQRLYQWVCEDAYECKDVIVCGTWHCALMRAMKGHVAASPAHSTSRYSSSSGFLMRGREQGGEGEREGEGERGGEGERERGCEGVLKNE